VDRFNGLGDPMLRAALLFARAAPQPVTADELANGLGLSRSVARWRLERLAETGLLQVGYERRTGRTGPGAGRPAKTYAPAPELASIEFPRRHYEALIRLLVAALPRPQRDERLSQIGRTFAEELARAARFRRASTSLPRALDAVCRSLGRIGFQASVESLREGGGIIVSATCPMRPLVVGNPSLRAVDEGMWEGLIAAATAGAASTRVTCRTHDCLDKSSACRIVVTLS
jgi:predicted ArsR family transcriptional regulator